MSTDGYSEHLLQAMRIHYGSVRIATSQTNKTKTNSGALVRQRTILTERPPLVGEVSANFSG
jgi:hypothetical protein